MWRGCCRSAGCRSRRSVLAAQHAAGADQRRGEAAPSRPVGAHAPGRREQPAALCSAACPRAVHAEQPGPPAKAPRQHAAQRRRVGVGGRDEAVGLDAGELEHAPARVDGASRLVDVEADELARATRRRSAAAPAATGPGAACARAGSRAGRSSRRRCGARPASSLISGERSPSGCRSRAGITSSVTRSTPWSSASRGSARSARTSPARCRAARRRSCARACELSRHAPPARIVCREQRR